MILTLLRLRLNNLYLSVMVFETQVDQFLVHQSQT